MNEIIRKITHEGELNLGGNKIICYVLEDGTRVLSGRGMANALKMTDENNKQSSGIKLGQNLKQKSLKPFVDKEKISGHFEPIICYRGDLKIHGYEATALTAICRIYSRATWSIHLSPRQRIIAKQCAILSESIMDVGIIALVDEATGYNKIRKETLQAILNLYISEKILDWKKTFQDDFYKEIFRLWSLPPSEGVKRPLFIGRLTNRYVYGNLPEGVLDELKKKMPKTKRGNYKDRLHQLLTDETGKLDLENTLRLIVWFLSVSETKEEFKKLERKYRLKKKSLYAGLDRQIEKEQIKEDFDKKFKALLNVPAPKKNK